ncbi:MAG: ISNCY family transposase [Vicinamibacterales bacterium]|nr:ISNCY family transposase [Vicinamibacterales bacterium]
MSARELTRVEVLSRVKAGTLTLRSAATVLAVSYRQAKRLARRYRAEGAKGLQHRSAGGASNHARPAADRARALALVREKYSSPVDGRFGPTLAAEHLASEDGVTVHHDTLRRWMLAAGLWSRARKRSPHRQRRARQAHFGELVQLDGSFHDWYETRGPRGCLMNLVDDATGRTLARLGDEETIWAAADALRRWIEAYGVPLALYTDWKNVYVRVPNAEEQGTGAVPLTQCGRMCASLGIQIIAASSPQAKGRVERNHGTHQDRLVKKLRRLGITDAPAANGFLETTYLPEHNRRFAVAPASAEDFHRRIPSRTTLDRVFQLEEARVLSNDWVVRYATRYFQVVRQSGQAPARSTVVVREASDGAIELRYRGRLMQWTEIAAPVKPTLPAVRPRLSSAPHRPARPSADHPWRRDTRALDRERALCRATQP